ncbi:MAG: soluble P-type ATPase [Candidatus Magnetoglobus multicellularis str. Araruama]|uniref:Soluble P-type ATPase n=1 Tax=Candidatus Magnetoglobus multicellularis str. Araruama TaxID=890399 RepID=A0A1V1PIX9_9BACT|nr:MAG: soluble P-type ATPase [Candidatus Magnetoglobus multicellularis str. Araruama]
MIDIIIPNLKEFSFEHLVLDLNGTLACRGYLLTAIEHQLHCLAQKINLHILTADTFGCGKAQMRDIQCKMKILKTNNQSQEKQDYVTALGASKCISIGNGYNDHLMLKAAAIGIAVIECEGAAVQSILNADIVCTNIKSALDLLIFPEGLIATLRN